MTDTTTEPTLRLDVRPLIAIGDEPFDTIMTSAAAIPQGGVLELTAPFQPLPLYPVMQRKGFRAETIELGEDEWVVRFQQTGITSETLLADVAARHPATIPILAKYGFDLCCGGAKPVEVAARAHGVELEVLLAELQGS